MQFAENWISLRPLCYNVRVEIEISAINYRIFKELMNQFSARLKISFFEN